VYAIYERDRGLLSFAEAIVGGFRGCWQERVILAPLPSNLYTLPDGPWWPDRLVGVALDDGGRYRVFSYAADLEGSRYRSTGLIYGGTFEHFPPGSPGGHAPKTSDPEALVDPTPPIASGDTVMDIDTVVARHETELVRAACLAEGFEATLAERVVALHRRGPCGLDLDGRSADGIAQYVRGLCRGVRGRGRPAASPPPSSSEA
jgi:hypothetical protein